MRIYKVKYPTGGDDSLLSHEYVATKREATLLAKEGNGDMSLLDVPTDKLGLIRFLNTQT